MRSGINNGISQEQLKSLLKYNRDSGEFVWITSRGRIKSGDVAGYKCPRGYIKIRIDTYGHYAHASGVTV